MVARATRAAVHRTPKGAAEGAVAGAPVGAGGEEFIAYMGVPPVAEAVLVIPVALDAEDHA